MIEWQKLRTSLLTFLLVACFGFFVDFQFMKADLNAVETEVAWIKNEMKRIDELKTIQCEVAIFIFKNSSELERIVRHCK